MIAWLDPLYGSGYAFWSGIGSGSPLLAGALAYWHHHNCHEGRCPRLGHPDESGRVICKKHHPAIRVDS